MLSLRSLIILFGLLAVALACAPHMPQREVQHGHCKFYVDGTTDDEKARKKRAPGSHSHGSHEHGGKKFNRSKKKKDVKCFEYEDGHKDDGAVLNKGVTYEVTVTKKN